MDAACSSPSDGGQSLLIEAMSKAGFYPQRPEHIEILQTHISYLMLLDHEVYKVKKALRFPFVDYSTLKARFSCCLEEVRLNRRLAPHVYQGTFAICADGATFRMMPMPVQEMIPGAVEYAVKMRRLPEARMLNELVATGQATAELARGIAMLLVDFHDRAESEQCFRYGQPAAVWQALAGNLGEIETIAGDLITPSELSELEQYNREFATNNWDLLKHRAETRRIREGHGDLRCEHICLAEETSIFDCVEFSERLRYCDVASELAFLAMDLDRLGAPRLGEELLSHYSTAADDVALLSLLPVYKCYRAAVRGKVEVLASSQLELGSEARELVRDRARRYFRLALGYARHSPSWNPLLPALLVVCGLSGTGKSTFARVLSDYTGMPVLSSDVIRKELAGVRPTESMRADYGEGIYTESFTHKTYSAMLDKASKILRSGAGVVVDATFKEAPQRERFAALGKDCGVPVLFVECRLDRIEVLRRLDERSRPEGQVSDATRSVYLRQLEEFVPMSAIPYADHIAVNGLSDLGKVIKRWQRFVQ